MITRRIALISATSLSYWATCIADSPALIPSVTGFDTSQRNGLVPRRLLIAVAVMWSTFGCKSSTEVEFSPRPALQTDGTSFRLEQFEQQRSAGYRVQIPYSFTNRSRTRIYLENCFGNFASSLEMQQDGQWIAVWGQPLLSCLSAPIVIERGEVFQDTLSASAALPGGSWGPQWIQTPEVSAEYRIVWLTGLSSYNLDGRQAPGALIPLVQRTSNTFTLVE